MAAITTALAATAAVVSVGKGIHDMSQGSKIAKQARTDRANYRRQDLRNAYAGITVPTRGAQLEREEAIRTQAEMSYLASQTGNVGVAQRISDYTRSSMERIGAQLDESQFRLGQLIAEDEARIRGMREEREMADLSAIGSREAYGESLRSRGLESTVSTLGSVAALSMDTDWGNTKLWGGGVNKGATLSPMKSKGLDTNFNIDTRTLR